LFDYLVLWAHGTLVDLQANIRVHLEVGYVKVNGGVDVHAHLIIPTFMMGNFQTPMPPK
jgi:hypothetical protein